MYSKKRPKRKSSAPTKKTRKVRKIKVWAIISDEGVQYDANGLSLSLAVYATKKDISARRKSVMIYGDKVVSATLSLPLPKKSKTKKI